MKYITSVLGIYVQMKILYCNQLKHSDSPFTGADFQKFHWVSMSRSLHSVFKIANLTMIFAL